MTISQPVEAPKIGESAAPSVQDQSGPISRGIDARDYDLRPIVNLFQRQAKVIAFCTLAGIALALTYLYIAPPQYTATARLMIDTRGQKILDGSEVRPGLTAETGTIESQVEILRSRRIAERVVRSGGAAAPANSGPRSASEVAQRDTFERSLRELMRNITVERQGLSLIIDVSFRAPDRNRAAQGANALADAFLADQYDQKSQATRHAGERLKAVVAAVNLDLRAAEERIQALRLEQAQVESKDSQGAPRELSAVLAKLAAAQVKATEAQRRVEGLQLQLNDPVVVTGYFTGPNALGDLRRRQVAVQRRLAEAIARSGQQHASVRSARAELGAVTKEIEQEGERLSKQGHAELELASTELAAIERDVSALKESEARRSNIAFELSGLERDTEATRQILVPLLRRLKEIDAQQGLQTVDAQVVAYAAPPLSPSSPKILLTLVAALLAGFASGIAVALVRETAARRH